MPPRKRQSAVKSAKPVAKRNKRQQRDDLDAGNGDVFLASEDEAAAGQSEEEEEQQENTEEKRLRLAKAYLKQLRASGAMEEIEEGEDDGGLGDDELGQVLKQQAQEAGGYAQRRIAGRIRVPLAEDSQPSTSGRAAETVRLHRCHRDAVTALALTHDDAVVYSVGKEGGIMRLDVASGTKSQIYRPQRGKEAELPQSGPEWVKKGPRQVSSGALLAVAVSSDGQLLAVGGGDRKVHVWDTRTHTPVQAYPGHKDSITGLAFRLGTHELYSASMDRSIKIWSLDDRAYVDTLFGHQAEVLALDALRQERVVSSGHDHTCRVWKIPEESQLIYRSHCTAVDCCRYVTGTEWVTGSIDGSLALWSQMKKKPAWLIRNAHPGTNDSGSIGGPEAGWIQSVCVCRGSDLVASGAGDGHVRLWQVQRGTGSNRTLAEIGGFGALGFVNALAIASSGRFVVAGMGQEPRLGRWARHCKARCGLLVHQLEVLETDT